MFEDVQICTKCGKKVEGPWHYECSEGGIGAVASLCELIEEELSNRTAGLNEDLEESWKDNKRLEDEVVALKETIAALEKKNKELTNVIDWLKGTK